MHFMFMDWVGEHNGDGLLCHVMFGASAGKSQWAKVTQSLGTERAGLEDLLPTRGT